MVKPEEKTQSQKFKDLAREAECEDDEEKFDAKLKRVAIPSGPLVEKSPKPKKRKRKRAN